MGFTNPSPIQSKTLPILLNSEVDFIGLAGTGTGKTAAFSIPLLQKIKKEIKSPQGLILCPTRELALQISKQIDLLGQFLNIKSLPVYGGAGYMDQLHGLKRGATIVVGTPGRVKDHLDRGSLVLDNVKTFILDEADEMISMGFKEDIETILQSIDRSQSNIWLFSATMNTVLKKVANSFLKNPLQVEINKQEVIPTNVTQQYYLLKESDKNENLSRMIEMAADFYGIVFCQTKVIVNNVTQFLITKGFSVDCLHGDKSQYEREKTMRSFRERKTKILVCTDVASRGLDVENVTHVVNYSLPLESEVYIHRIGRTARSGKSGHAVSFITPSQKHMLHRVERLTRSVIEELRPPSKKELAQYKVEKLLTKFLAPEKINRAVELVSSDWKTSLKNMPAEEIAARFFNIIYPEVFESSTEIKKAETVREENTQESRYGTQRRSKTVRKDYPQRRYRK